MTPTKGFKVVECITICSSADTSQLSTSEHLAPRPTPICYHVPPPTLLQCSWPPWCSSHMPDIPPHLPGSLHFSIIRMLFWIHVALLISYLSVLLKYRPCSAYIKMQSFPISWTLPFSIAHSALFFSWHFQHIIRLCVTCFLSLSLH